MCLSWNSFEGIGLCLCPISDTPTYYAASGTMTSLLHMGNVLITPGCLAGDLEDFRELRPCCSSNWAIRMPRASCSS